jgi:hypothetical protein
MVEGQKERRRMPRAAETSQNIDIVKQDADTPFLVSRWSLEEKRSLFGSGKSERVS